MSCHRAPCAPRGPRRPRLGEALALPAPPHLVPPPAPLRAAGFPSVACWLPVLVHKIVGPVRAGTELSTAPTAQDSPGPARVSGWTSDVTEAGLDVDLGRWTEGLRLLGRGGGLIIRGVRAAEGRWARGPRDLHAGTTPRPSSLRAGVTLPPTSTSQELGPQGSCRGSDPVIPGPEEGTSLVKYPSKSSDRPDSGPSAGTQAGADARTR